MPYFEKVVKGREELKIDNDEETASICHDISFIYYNNNKFEDALKF